MNLAECVKSPYKNGEVLIGINNFKYVAYKNKFYKLNNNMVGKLASTAGIGEYIIGNLSIEEKLKIYSSMIKRGEY